MKKTLSLVLSALMLSTAAIGCAPAQDRLDPAITLASSDAQANARWLDDRLDDFPTDVVIGLGSDTAYGVDMSDFEDDGYVLRTIGDETLIFGKTADGLDRAVRKYAKAAEAGAAVELDETYHEGYRIEKLTIAGNDISEYGIYYPAANNESMLFGVTELQRLVEIACGVKLSANEGKPKGKYIEFRFLEDETINASGYKYRVENGNIIIEGKSDFGCPNAVYRMLEEECGWTGLTYGDSILSEAEHVDITDGTDYVGNPRFDYFYTGTVGNRWNSDNLVPNAAQMSYGRFDGRIYAGKDLCACHGIQRNNWIHPELYTAMTQPCYSNEEIYSEMYTNVHTYVETQVASGKHIGVELLSVDVSHPDVMGFCQCKDCLQVVRKENGSNAGTVVRFTNRLVEDMRADYDGIKYLIFAYQGTQKPCNTEPDKDIVVTFCTDRICANHALNDGECDYGVFYSHMTNQVLCTWLEGWMELAEDVYIWHYAMEGGFGSANFVDTIYEDLLYFEEVGAKGVFMCADNAGVSMNRTVFQLEYAINWDRDMTKEEYWAKYEELLERDYGDGWDYIQKCAEYWIEGENRNGCWHCWRYEVQVTEQYAPYCAENFDEVYRLAKQAIPLADSAEQEILCVRFLAMMIYHGCNASYFTAYDAEDNAKLALLEERWAEIWTLLKACGVDPATTPLGLSSTCEEEAWTAWVEWRDKLTFGDAKKRPMPEEYEASAK